MIIEKVASEEKKGEGSCILVGIPLDANGRELLDWALSKVAKQGDRVVAVHVCRKSGNNIHSTRTYFHNL